MGFFIDLVVLGEFALKIIDFKPQLIYFTDPYFLGWTNITGRNLNNYIVYYLGRLVLLGCWIFVEPVVPDQNIHLQYFAHSVETAGDCNNLEHFVFDLDNLSAD